MTVTGLPALGALALGIAMFVAALCWKRFTTPVDDAERAAPRSRRSMAGVAVQILAFMIACAGPPRVALDPGSAAALLQGAIVLALWAGSVALFVAAAHAMGRNWSIAARTRDDHQLVQAGPFARLRHPIYTAIALQLIGSAIGLGHVTRLVAALPLYGIGTWLRIAEEERLLRAMFGPAYDIYAMRVKRFVPGMF